MKLLQFDIRNHVLCYILVSMMYLQLCCQLSSANPVCNTTECKKLADYYKGNMNEQEKPCNNFYDYVCKNWGAHNPRPIYRPNWSVNGRLIENSKEQLKSILESTQLPAKDKVQQARTLYKECINLPFMERSDPNIVKPVMRAAGYWPTLNKDTQTTKLETWWQIDNYYIGKTGESSVFDLHLVADIYNNNRITVTVHPPKSPYGMLKLFKPLDAEHTKYYKEFLREVIKNVSPYSITNSMDISDADLEDIIQFREEIRKISYVEDAYNKTVLIELGKFQTDYNNFVSGHEATKINWLELFRSFCKNSKYPYLMTFHKTSKAIIYIPYFAHLARILEKTPKNIIVYHVHLYFAERHLKLSTQMEANLEKSVKGDIHATNVIRYEPPRWSQCVNDINMETTLGIMYINSYFPKIAVKEVKALLDEEYDLFKVKISRSSWLDVPTKYKMLAKVNHFTADIGFPEWYLPGRNASAMRPNPVTVNPAYPLAYFAQQLTKLAVSASYLQWPVYVPNMPYVTRYGSIGFVLAHELSHGLLDRGLNFDEFGHKRNLLSNDMLRRYNEKADCFHTQYNKYRSEELKKRNIKETPETSTFSEDVADAMGLKIAYLAYRLNTMRLNGSCPMLPNFEKFDCDKLFFISYANVFCADSKPGIEELNLIKSIHSIPKIRINGAVGNMKEFHKAFQCKPNDPIIPEKLCDMWD